MRMRNFTKRDWEIFAGCASGSPTIGEIELTNSYGDNLVNTVIIQDGLTLEVIGEAVSTEASSECELNTVAFRMELATAKVAYLIANALPEIISTSDLKKLGFEQII